MFKLLSCFIALCTICAPVFAQQSKKIDSLKLLLETRGKDTVRVNILNQLAKEVMFAKDQDYVFSLALEQLALSQQLNYAKGVARAYLMIGNYYNIAGKRDSALTNYKHSLTLNLARGDLGQIGRLFYNIGTLHHNQGNYDSALYYYRNASSALTRVKDYKILAWVSDSYGMIFKDKGNYDSALYYQLKAVASAEISKDSMLISRAYNNVGIIFKRKGDLAKALDYTFRALRVSEKLNDRFGECSFLSCIADVYTEANDTTSALLYYRKTLALASEIKETMVWGGVYHNMGKLYYNAGDYDKALKYYRLGLQYKKKHNQATWIATSYTGIGSVYLKKGDYKKAIEFLNEGLSINQRLKLKTQLAETHASLSHAYMKLNNYRKAFEHNEQYHAYQDSVFNIEKEKSITEIEEKYKAEKKEQQILALQQSNQIKDLEISKNNVLLITIALIAILIFVTTVVFIRLYMTKRKTAAILIKANLEKETLLKEIHHRVKNNLQLVISLLEWQADDNTDATVLKLIDEGRSRVESMALIHELLYQHDNLGSINFADYTTRLCNHIKKCFNRSNILLTQHVAQVCLDLKHAIPLALIINELVTNSFKYAFSDKESGSISILLQEMDINLYQLTVEDNGRGIGELTLKDSLGLQLVSTLVRQLNGTLTIQNNPGASFIIRFAIRKTVNIQNQEIYAYA